MIDDVVYENLVEAIKEKIPQRGKLTNVLVDMLFIEKEAVYRRLRGEVPFTFSEIATIARELNISLDNIIGTDSPKSRPFQLKLTEYYNPAEADYHMHEEFVNLLGTAKNSEKSEFGFANSVLPLHFSIKYEAIQSFYILKWLYQFGSPGSVPAYSSIVPSERMKNISREFLSKVEDVKYTYFIWDKLTLLYLVNDINYFKSIRLITKEEVVMLKNEILRFLNDLEQLAIKGSYDNGNKVHLYVSSLNFDTTYTYFETDDCHLTLIKTFTLNETASLDETVFCKMKTFIQALKRTSTMISESDEKNRIMFFEQQKEILEDNLT